MCRSTRLIEVNPTTRCQRAKASWPNARSTIGIRAIVGHLEQDQRGAREAEEAAGRRQGGPAAREQCLGAAAGDPLGDARRARASTTVASTALPHQRGVRLAGRDAAGGTWAPGPRASTSCDDDRPRPCEDAGSRLCREVKP